VYNLKTILKINFTSFHFEIFIEKIFFYFLKHLYFLYLIFTAFFILRIKHLICKNKIKIKNTKNNNKRIIKK